MKKIYYCIIILFFVQVVLEIITIYTQNSVATNSVQASVMSKKIDELEEVNAALRSEILTYTSYEQIASKAATLGFVEAKHVISLSSPLPVAIKHDN